MTIRMMIAAVAIVAAAALLGRWLYAMGFLRGFRFGRGAR